VKTLSAGASLRASRGYAAPHYLVTLDFTVPSAKTLNLSDQYVSTGLGDFLPYVASWGTLADALNLLDVDGSPATAEMTLINTVAIEGRARISDLIRSPQNTVNAYEWAYAKVTIYQLFEGLTTGDEIKLGVFYLEEPLEIGEDLLTVRMSDQSLVVEDRLRIRRVTRTEFPLCGKSQVGQSIPRTFGVLTNVPAIPVIDGPANQLNGALTATATSVTLLDASDFPASPELFPTGFWTQSGLGSFNGSRVNDGVFTLGAFHLDGASVGAVLRFDAGAGNTRIFEAVWLTFNVSSPAGQWEIEYSDNGSTFTVVASLPFSGTEAATSWVAQSHRYWRLRLSSVPAAGGEHAEVQWYGPGFLGQCEQELMRWRTRSGNTLNNVVRGRHASTAIPHDDRTTFFGIRSGPKAYRFAVAEDTATFAMKAITNIKVNGLPTTLATAELGATDILSGARFGVINFNVGDVKTFHSLPVEGHSLPHPVATNLPLVLDQTIDSLGNATWQFLLTVTLQAPAEPYTVTGTVSRHVVMTFESVSGLFSLSGTNTIRHRDPSNGTITLFTDNAGPGFDFTGATYDYTTGANVTNETFELNLSGDADNWRFIWTITVYTLSGATLASIAQAGFRTGTGAGDSTSRIVIGDVTCDLEGIQDDSGGSLSGTALLLLENPADVTRFILTQLYSVSAGDLGTTWNATRTSLVAAGLKWALRLDYTLFSNLRRKLGEQARAALYLEAGRWEYEFLETTPTAQLTLDYLRDVWSDQPARVTRTARVDVRNSLNVSAQRDYAANTDRYLKVHEDLTHVSTPQRADLVLDLVQQEATATALGDYWLTVWRRQRFSVELVTWWNALALEKIDYLALANHPILTAHGGTALVFRIVGKDYLVGDDNPGRIRLQLIEAGT
jgi:hypothetical protein